MRRLQQITEENRRVHQLHPHRVPHRPTAHEQQRSQATGIQMVDFRNIEHQHADTLELLDPAPELVERYSAHHASGAVHDRHILQAFDLKFEFHMSIHTNLLRKKFRDLSSLNWTRGKGKSHHRKTSWRASNLRMLRMRKFIGVTAQPLKGLYYEHFRHR